MEQLCGKFSNDGYLVLESIFQAHEIDTFRTKSMQNFDDVMSIIRSGNLSFGIGTKNCFKEIVQRHKLRYEVPYGMDNDSFDALYTNSIIRNVIENILGPDAIIINRSLVLSFPGTEEQSWHSDGPHLSITEYLPCHCLNVFIPLIDLMETHGPTELRPESQKMTQDLTKSFLIAAARKQLRKPVAPLLQRGSVLIFDYRILHRGKANVSSETRPIFVLTFAKAGFKDMLNFPARSIFDSLPAEPPTTHVAPFQPPHDTVDEMSPMGAH